MRARGFLVLLALAATPGCHFWKNLTKTCQDIRVDISNSEQSLDAIAIVGPGAPFTADKVLASGQSRSLMLCVDKGDREEFRASREGVIVAVARCAVVQTPEEGGSASVVWTLQGFLCQNW